MKRYWETLAFVGAGVATIWAVILCDPARAELTKDVYGRIFYTPYGQCQVVPQGVSLRDLHVICSADYPDLTGDGKPEQLVTMVTIRDGRLRCGYYWVRDLTCNSDRDCHRTLETQKECF